LLKTQLPLTQYEDPGQTPGHGIQTGAEGPGQGSTGTHGGQSIQPGGQKQTAKVKLIGGPHIRHLQAA